MNDDFFHDAAACLIRDGKTIAAVEEERFNRIKKTTKFPTEAIRACLDLAGVTPSQIDAVGHYFQEIFVDRALHELYLQHPEAPIRYSRELITDHLGAEFGIELPAERLVYAEHHVSHAASCFLRSGMKDALVVVMDGRGEMHSTTVFRGGRGGLEPLATYGIDKSLGQFYEAATHLLGYRMGDEYKVMGLAPYGDANVHRDIFDSLYTLRSGGDFELRPITGAFFVNGFVPRRKGQDFTREHMDFAAGVQRTLERIAMHVLGYWADYTGLTKLCFVGGVAHNSSLNGVILRSGKFDEVFIHPAAHDAGAAEGAALAAATQLGEAPARRSRLFSASLGPALGDHEDVQRELASWGDLVLCERPADIVECAAELLAGGAVLGWAQGRSEFGPRALGNRSILADARPGENKHRINSMVKKREGYRPFAPVVTEEAADTYFELPPTRANYDFMSFVVQVREERRTELGAVTHVDGSARLQIVTQQANERFHRLVQRFGELTGTPVLLNTSFNNNAEPIVQTVQDAVTCFLTTELDYLVIEDFLIRRRWGHWLGLDGLVPRHRPVTRLAKRVRTTPAGHRDVVHEISLDYTNGPRAEISPAAFAVLEAADGKRTLESLAGDAGVSDDLRKELHLLWQGRFFVLAPTGP
ncbi:carbamoyltransferase C-terminal domain-containing protein [Nonomuraea sp. NPDC049419]|uniref:carbamoyltransferase family protein n=1 Tax=Nonomuraea sp. NPDC049419 TaxID=3155772 RepID=UPI003441E748